MAQLLQQLPRFHMGSHHGHGESFRLSSLGQWRPFRENMEALLVKSCVSVPVLRPYRHIRGILDTGFASGAGTAFDGS